MVNSLVRYLKRLLVLLPGLLGAYFVATDVYPALDRQVPAGLALLLAYVFAAYVLIPALLRVVRIFFHPNHIPHYCVTADGFASDPINIGLVGTKSQIEKAMKTAGWYAVDARTIKSIFKMGMSIVLRRPYPTAPFSSLYLFGRKQDLGFQVPIGDTPNKRHHVRFWMTEPTLSKSEKEHLDFWQKFSRAKKKVDKTQLWVGAASKDVGIGFIRHNAQFTHSVHPDTDAERDLIVENLEKANAVKTKRSVTVGEAYKIRNRVFRSHLKTDGKMCIVTLK